MSMDHMKSLLINFDMTTGLSPDRKPIQRRLSACRGLFRHLLREGQLKRDPSGDVQAPKARKRLPTPLDADTMARLLEFRGDDSLPGEAAPTF